MNWFQVHDLKCWAVGLLACFIAKFPICESFDNTYIYIAIYPPCSQSQSNCICICDSESVFPIQGFIFYLERRQEYKTTRLASTPVLPSLIPRFPLQTLI